MTDIENPFAEHNPHVLSDRIYAHYGHTDAVQDLERNLFHSNDLVGIAAGYETGLGTIHLIGDEEADTEGDIIVQLTYRVPKHGAASNVWTNLDRMHRQFLSKDAQEAERVAQSAVEDAELALELARQQLDRVRNR